MLRPALLFLVALVWPGTAAATSCEPMWESHYFWCDGKRCRVEFITRDLPTFGVCARYRQTFDGDSQRGRWMESLGRLLGEPEQPGAFRIDLWTWPGHSGQSTLEHAISYALPDVDITPGFDALDAGASATVRELANRSPARGSPWRPVNAERLSELARLRASIEQQGHEHNRRAVWRFALLDLLPALPLLLMLGYSQWRFHQGVWSEPRPLAWKHGWVLLSAALFVCVACAAYVALMDPLSTVGCTIVLLLALLCLAVSLVALLTSGLIRAVRPFLPGRGGQTSS